MTELLKYNPTKHNKIASVSVIKYDDSNKWLRYENLNRFRNKVEI